jgi:hypothetical protein
MDEKQALEELTYIKQIIDESRKTIIYNGKDYIFWGIIVAFGMLLHVFIYIYWLWLIIVAVGWSYSFYLHFTQRKKRRKSTFAGKIIWSVWLANGIGMSIIGFIGTYSHGVNPAYLNAIFASLLATAYFISGMIVDNKIMRVLSILWWCGSIAMFFFPGDHTFLIMAAMMILFQVIPGIIIFKEYKKEIGSNA